MPNDSTDDDQNSGDPQIERVSGGSDPKPPSTHRSAGELGAAGETMATGLSSALDDDAPLEQRKSGVKQLGSLVSGIVNGVMEHKERKQRLEEKRAKEAQLEPVEDKPSCECGFTFSRLPQNASRISCPQCGREYEVQ